MAGPDDKTPSLKVEKIRNGVKITGGKIGKKELTRFRGDLYHNNQKIVDIDMFLSLLYISEPSLKKLRDEILPVLHLKGYQPATYTAKLIKEMYPAKLTMMLPENFSVEVIVPYEKELCESDDLSGAGCYALRREIITALNTNPLVEWIVLYLTTESKFSGDLINLKKNQSGSEVSDEFKKTLKALYNFIDNDAVIPIIKISEKSNLDVKMKIVTEIASLLIFPELLNQTSLSLCGIDIFLRTLIQKSPLQFVTLALELATKGYSDSYLPVQGYEGFENNETSIINALMSSIRSTYNHPLVDYDPTWTLQTYLESKLPQNLSSALLNLIGKKQLDDFSSFVEIFRGATLPKEIVELFSKAGYEILEDSMYFKDIADNKMNPLHQFILGGLYSDKHQEVDANNQLDHLLLALSTDTLDVQGLVSNQLYNLLDVMELESTDIYTEETYVRNESNPLLGIEQTHYVKLLSITENEDSSLTVQLNTYGRIFNLNNLPRALFDEHFQGFIVTAAPNTKTAQPADETFLAIKADIDKKIAASGAANSVDAKELSSAIKSIERDHHDPKTKIYLLRLIVDKKYAELTNSIPQKVSSFFTPSSSSLLTPLKEIIEDRDLWIKGTASSAATLDEPKR